MEHPWQTVLGHVPSKANNYKIVYRAGHASIGKSDTVENYEQTFFLQVKPPYRGLLIKGFFELYVRVYFETQSPDLDNSLKTILDCLQYTKTIKNDNKCVKIVAEKYVDKINPRVEFKIVELQADAKLDGSEM